MAVFCFILQQHATQNGVEGHFGNKGTNYHTSSVNSYVII